MALAVDVSHRDLVFDSEDYFLAMDTVFDGDEFIIGGYEMEIGEDDEEIVVS